MAEELLGRQPAMGEARALYRMIGVGSTVDELMDLIRVHVLEVQSDP
jgi:hypothetical protein